MTGCGRTVAIVQSNYIPWKGYFDLVDRADELILLDHVQFTRRDWRNRNRIKTARGPQWLTIPVRVRGRYLQRIDETEVMDRAWAEKHWRTIEQAYARAGRFAEHAPALERLYRETDERLLTCVNHRFLTVICGLLGIGTVITRSTEYEIVGTKTDTLLALCEQAGASVYLSGPAARAYLDESRFADAGIAIEWMDYAGYREYPQLHPPFVHEVSVVDLLLNAGTDAAEYLARVPPS